MRRLRLYDIRLSRLPDRLGLCTGDLPQLCTYINAAQERLLTAKESGSEGWWGSWAEVRFNVSNSNPFITTPREIARLEMIDVCGQPIQLNNQFFEYMQFGAGRSPRRWQNSGGFCGFWRNRCQAYTRNNAITFDELLPTPQIIRVFSSDPADTDGTHRVLLQGMDANGAVVYSQDGNSQVMGVFLTLNAPFVDSPFPLSRITGIQKDITAGQLQFFQVDPTTGVQNNLHTMEPGEQTALYRRYYLNRLPFNCCQSAPNPCQPLPPSVSRFVQVTAMAKLELIPVTTDTDYLLISSAEAVINECESIRYEGMDNATAAGMADRKHRKALGLLNGQLSHYLGIDQPAVNFKPFGDASLERVAIGMI
jgi:hypothetical protein